MKTFQIFTIFITTALRLLRYGLSVLFRFCINADFGIVFAAGHVYPFCRFLCLFWIRILDRKCYPAALHVSHVTNICENYRPTGQVTHIYLPYDPNQVMRSFFYKMIRAC